jgi:hypothetical protein
VLRCIGTARIFSILGVALIVLACQPETPKQAQPEPPQEIQQDAPKEVCDRGEVPVFADEIWYREYEGSEQRFTGPLAFIRPQAMAGGRYRAFNVGETAVYGGGDESIDLMKAWVGKSVTIQGKLVDLGFGPEVWPGTIDCAPLTR